MIDQFGLRNHLEYAPRDSTERGFTLTLPADYQPIPLPGRDEWLTALRSGDYAQCRGQLVEHGVEDSYCCLGVACRVMGLPMEAEGPVGLNHGFEFHGRLATKSLPVGCPMAQAMDTHGRFPEKVSVSMVGGEEVNGEEVNGKGLTFLNDKLKFNFHQIAWVIEHIWSHAPLP